MRPLLAFTLFFSLSSQAFALDSFSIVRKLGTAGALGTDVLQIVCVKEQCQLSSSHNDQVTAKKDLPFKEIEPYFATAQKALEEKTAKSPDKSKNLATLEWKDKKWEHAGLTSNLLALESELKARLRK